MTRVSGVLQPTITYPVDAVDKFLVQIRALDERVQVHQRLNCVFEAVIDSLRESLHFLLTTVETLNR